MWIRQKRAAAMLGVSERWLRTLLNNGRGPKAEKVGKVWRLKLEDVRAYMEARELDVGEDPLTSIRVVPPSVTDDRTQADGGGNTNPAG